ncbi:MAG: hypothetical protein J6L62_07195 [Clostridia bacterium]|nr:hypothetical protein [Clostridia bacterium]
MANLRIDNFSGDTVTVILDGKTQTVGDDSKVTFEAVEKGQHSLHLHRTRVPLETADINNENGKSFKEELEDKEKSMHTHLDSVARIELTSSKAVVTIKTDVILKEGKGLDTIFSSYSVNASGANLQDERKIFSSPAVRKNFISYHIKNAMFPTGICGAVVLILALISLVCALTGNPVNLGGTVFTLPWAAGLTAVASAVCGYVIFCIANIMKTAKKYTK